MAAQRTAGAILNEATEGISRDMEGSRRAALTNVSLRGELDNQRYREAEFQDKEAERNRNREFLGKARDLGRRHFVKRVPRQGQQAAIPTGAPGEVLPPVEYDEVPVDLGSPEGVKAVGEYQADLFKLRTEFGFVSPEETAQLLDFRKKLDDMGATNDLRAALGNDPAALEKISKIAGIKGMTQLSVGFDEIGSPDLYATVNAPGADGTMTQKRVRVGHLMAVVSPNAYGAIMDKVTSVAKDRSALQSDDVSRRTAITNAGANATQAAADMIRARTSERTQTARSESYGAHATLSETLAKRTSSFRLPRFTTIGPDGKAQAVPDDEAAGIVSTIGGLLIDKDGLGGGEAFNAAESMLSELNNKTRADYDTELERARAEVQKQQRAGNKDALKQARSTLMDLEDNGALWFQTRRQTYIDKWRAIVSNPPAQR